MKENYHKYTKEPQYKNIKKMIICEEYLENSKGFLTEYKLHCFDGKVKFIEVHTDRFNGYKENYYYPDWTETEFRGKLKSKADYITKPKNLEKLIELGESLAYGFTYVRVDFNGVDNIVEIGYCLDKLFLESDMGIRDTSSLSHSLQKGRKGRLM